MITILLWHLVATLVLAAALGGVSLAQWAIQSSATRLRTGHRQAPPTDPARPLVSGGAPRG